MAKTKKSIFRLDNTAFWSFVMMILGAILGLLFPEIMGKLKFIGDIWIDCIQMMLIPLVLCIVTLAIGSQEDMRTLGRVAVRITIYYILTTLAAIAIGLGLALLLKPARGVVLSDYEITEISQTTSFTVEAFVTGLFSSNIFASFSEGNLLQTMVIAILLGVAVLRVKNQETKLRFINAIESFNDVINEFLRMLIKLAPIAVLFLIADSFSKYGFSIFSSMVGLIGTFWLSILVNTLVVYCTILWAISGINPVQFIKDTAEVWTFAIASCSGAACIPLSIKNVKEKFQVPDHIADFCLTIGGQLNSHGTALMYGCVLVFISQMYNIPLSLGAMIQIILVGSLISASGGGIPGSGIVKLSILVSTFGFPAEIVGITAGFYRFFDMGTTTGNVLGDVAGTVTVAKLEERTAKKRGIPLQSG